MYTVSHYAQATYTLKDVKDRIAGIFADAWENFSSLKPGDSVLIKPNFLSAKPPESAVTTHPVVIEAIVQLFLDHGCSVTIGDSPALHKLETVVKRAGLTALKQRYPIRFQDLAQPVTVKGMENGTFKSFEVSRHCFEHDYFINVAKFKTHSMMGLTLCVKNLFGCVPGRRKAAWHLAIGKNRRLFARMLAELSEILPVDFHLIDGIIGMEGNGPGNGTPIGLGVLLGGENAPVVDGVALRLIGLAPMELLTSRAAAELGIGPSDFREITLKGDALPSTPLPFRLPEPTGTDWGLPGFFKGILRWFFLPYPAIDPSRCRQCLDCMRVCPPEAIYTKEGKVLIREKRCIRCYCCQEVCPENAIAFRRRELAKIIGTK